MKWLDLTLPTPAENLACDEALLDWCESGGSNDELLRFWEPAAPFVVVGYANAVSKETDPAACARWNIPILRRCSGGGTVVQGPGCLSYALILKQDGARNLSTIPEANRFILERNRTALNGLLRGEAPEPPAGGPPQGDEPWPRRSLRSPQFPTAGLPPEITLEGQTDLAVSGLKISGNAQRRRKRFVLFHGTILLHADLQMIERVLPLPARQPDYRRNRSHRDFLVNLELPAEPVKRALRQAWQALEPLGDPPLERIRLLARDKYETTGWNLKFS